MKRIIILLSFLLMAMPAAIAQNDVAAKAVNKKNMVVKEWNTGAKGARQLDHITTYSAEGKKVEEIEYDSENRQKWRKRYEWGANLRMTRELVYDGHNRLVNYKTFEYNEFGKKKVQYTYSPKGKLLSTKVYEYITQDE